MGIYITSAIFLAAVIMLTGLLLKISGGLASRIRRMEARVETLGATLAGCREKEQKSLLRINNLKQRTENLERKLTYKNRHESKNKETE